MSVARSLFVLFVAGLCALQAQEPSLPTVSTARELRNLSADEAVRHYPVRLRATVTLVEPQRTIFLRDDTGATFIRWGKDLPEVHAGQRIEVEGETYPGLYLTGITARTLNVLGEGDLPAPRPVTYEQLASGEFHYDWVEVRGIVRSITPSEKYAVLKLALGNGSIDVYPVTDDANADEHLVDATVRVTGLAAGYINDRRQLVAPHLRVRSLANLAVLEPAPDDPFAVDVTPAAELLRFAPNGRAGHRVKVRGAVTYQEPGGAVYLRDDVQGLRVHTATAETFAPGEVVEALGFPSMGTLNAELDDATLRRTGEMNQVAATAVAVKDLVSGKLDGDLVTLEAGVRDVIREPDRLRLALQAEKSVFEALARASLPEDQIPAIGATVRVTGICRVTEATQPTRSFSTRARTFELLLRDGPGDLAIVRRPPWWTARRLAVAAGTLFGLTLLGFGWAALLRRQVRRQTALIRTQVEAVTVAKERQRIAREFHDTLEQELVGVSLRLDAANTRTGDSTVRELITGTQRLVHQLQAGARSFVWNLRESSLTSQVLADAIRAATTRFSAGRQVEIRTVGDPRRLPESIGHELLRVAQEATANAAKHGNARLITITLDFSTPNQTRLQIEDDGKGFDPNAPVPDGHFGLLGIWERVQKLGGQIQLDSKPGAGTSIQVTIASPA